MKDVNGLIFHHTAGRGSPEGVVNTLNKRGLGAQYVMDREGKVFQLAPDGAKTAHMTPAQNGTGLSNDNAIGIEMIAKNNADLTEAQKIAGLKFADEMKQKYPGIGDNIYGHGEVNRHKEADEGMGVVDLYRQRRDQIAQPQAPDNTAAMQAQVQAEQAQQQALQQQIEAQRRLQEQTQLTTGSLQTMPQPLQGVQTGMQGLEGGLAGMIGQIGSGVPVVGQFGNSIQQMLAQMAMPTGGGGGFSGLFSGLLGFADGGHVAGPGTPTSDSIPAMLSDGEFVVNAKATKKNRRALEMINSGRVPAFAKGGIVGGSSFASNSVYSPTINVSANGLPGGNAMANQIAKTVSNTLDDRRPDTFGKTDAQRMTEMSLAMQRTARRNG